MKKQDLIEAVQKAAEIKKVEAERAVNAVFDEITKALAKREDVVITGFGSFKVVQRAARAGVNPKTGEKIQIPATIRPKFKPGKALKEAVK